MTRRKLLLVGWDAADWKIIHPLLDAGQMPALARLVDGGVSGNLTTLEPALSPMLWTSIATGKMAYHHGVVGFTEIDPQSGAVVPVSAATRRCRTVWEMLADRGLRSHVVSWFATQGERDMPGKMVSNLYGHLKGMTSGQGPDSFPPAQPGTYWPPELAQDMDALRVSSADIDPDDVIRLFVPDAPAVDQQADPRLAELAELLAQAFSVHNAATHLMATDPDWDFMAVYYRTIDEISHHFMHCHPPRMDGVPEEDFERYQHVVNATYRLHDLFLARLMQLAGPDVAVVLVSDHGYHSDHLRPRFTPRVPAGITVWHRSQGVLAAAGPGFRKDAPVHGARLLDITPTILHWFGLPVGEDMEGRVLREALEVSAPVLMIPTWEQGSGPQHERRVLAGDERQALIQQFVALGYIDQPPEDSGQAALITRRENDWNLARAYLFGGHFEQALPLLQSCLRSAPTRTDFGQALARCQLRLGLVQEAEQTLEKSLGSVGDHPDVCLLRAQLAIEHGRSEEALAILEQLGSVHRDSARMQALLARAYLRQKQFEQAERAARTLLRIDPDHYDAFMVLARVALARRDAEQAVDQSLNAIGVAFGSANAHYLLGVALMQRRCWGEAAHALRNCLRLEPHFAIAHRLLSRVYRALGDDTQAELQRALSVTRVIERRRVVAERSAAARSAMSERERVWAEEDRAQLERSAAADDWTPVPPRVVTDRPPINCIVVSGLPRSGTSLMMQILKAAGLPLLTDGVRAADPDNPEGYWEWETIKRLPLDPRVIEQADGKAVKIISALLPALPARHRYRIVYMTRPVAEVVASQNKMLMRNGRAAETAQVDLAGTLSRHQNNLLQALRAHPALELLEVAYPDLVAEPEAVIRRVAAFIGEPFVMSAGVPACVNPALHRNRAAA